MKITVLAVSTAQEPKVAGIVGVVILGLDVYAIVINVVVAIDVKDHFDGMPFPLVAGWAERTAGPCVRRVEPQFS